jgi:RNA polymerase sigma-70 factor (ECF subfamily)
MKNPTLDYDGAGNDDYLLMERLTLHQQDALSTLHARYCSVLRHFVLQIVHDDADAEDVVQDVFVQIWSRPEMYCAAKGKPFGWLLTLSRRRAIDCLRRRNAYRRAAERFEVAHQRSPVHAGAESSVRREACRDDLRDYLKKLISQLPPAQQVIVEHGFFHGMSQRQIAAFMGLPLGTVKTRMELGLKKLSHAAVPGRDRIE